MRVAINESTLTAIGDAIREKTDTTDLLAPGAMPAAIRSITTGEGGGSGEADIINISGNCEYACSGALAEGYIRQFPDKVRVQIGYSAKYMFFNYSLDSIPFDIYLQGDENSDIKMERMFQMAKIKELPTFHNTVTARGMEHMFDNCYYLESITDNFADCLDGMTGGNDRIFEHCFNLKYIPTKLCNFIQNRSSDPDTYGYVGAFDGCYLLQSIEGLGVYSGTVNVKINRFANTFDYCGTIKELTFQLDGSNVKTATWTNQVIDLSNGVGYLEPLNSIASEHLQRPAENVVKDDATYQEFKDKDYWNTWKKKYSRYNKDSAVNTIYTLPDTSAFVAEQGGTNTIKFRGDSGSATDGGAIDTMPETAIAAAAAKGWTVTFIY